MGEDTGRLMNGAIKAPRIRLSTVGAEIDSGDGVTGEAEIPMGSVLSPRPWHSSIYYSIEIIHTRL